MHITSFLRSRSGLGALTCAVLLPLTTPAAPKHGLPADFNRLNIGDAAPDFDLPGIDGRHHTLADFADHPLLMVVFLSNHCPVSHAIEPRLIELADSFGPHGLGVVAINPNHPDAVSITELGYSKYGDSFEEMKPYAEEAGFTFPYLYDGETQSTAKAYGSIATPHVFLFDHERKLRYAGRFDDSRFADADSVTSPDAQHAVEALLGGQSVLTPETRAFGCSTKWKEKIAKVAAIDEAWRREPVTVESIDPAGLATLLTNPTDKLRLFNIWATWCAPCVEEMPGLVRLTRQLGNRKFEVITVSLDTPQQPGPVQRFLESQRMALPKRLRLSVEAEGRATNNYLFAGHPDALGNMIDPDWAGALPYTFMVAPGGEVIHRHPGQFDFATLQNAVLEYLGTTYQPKR